MPRSVNTYPERFNSTGVSPRGGTVPFLTPAAFLLGNIRKCIPRFSSARALLTNVCPPVRQEPGQDPPPQPERGGWRARARKKAEERSGKRTYVPGSQRHPGRNVNKQRRLATTTSKTEGNDEGSAWSVELDPSLAQTPATLHNCCLLCARLSIPPKRHPEPPYFSLPTVLASYALGSRDPDTNIYIGNKFKLVASRAIKLTSHEQTFATFSYNFLRFDSFSLFFFYASSNFPSLSTRYYICMYTHIRMEEMNWRKFEQINLVYRFVSFPRQLENSGGRVV